MPRRTLAQVVADCHAAVMSEAAEHGVAGLSIEGVSRRAGVAKTSIYRRWTTVEDLLLDAVSIAHPTDAPSPAGGNLRGDLLQSLRLLTGWLSGPYAPIVAAILAERHRRPELAEALYVRVFDPHGTRFTRLVLHHYAELGEIDPACVTPTVCDIGEALVIKHQIDTGELPDEAALTDIVDQAIMPAVGHPPPNRSAG